MKRRLADARAGQMVFDKVMLQPEPDSCRCPRCLKAFRDSLRRKYPTRGAAR